ncbi:hypothetical protein B9Z55_007794 [Caenorhabditis nigoni]|uniref:Uncharacterized protein n=1 Tax=Caenorhabditis nigoni TaxID=1611254 RepID=A0A2G5VBB0_9PELO|nr:hypothetical protein B9Z55_007794 [Caenorhabditis nigoni]
MFNRYEARKMHVQIRGILYSKKEKSQQVVVEKVLEGLKYGPYVKEMGISIANVIHGDNKQHRPLIYDRMTMDLLESGGGCDTQEIVNRLEELRWTLPTEVQYEEFCRTIPTAAKKTGSG